MAAVSPKTRRGCAPARHRPLHSSRHPGDRFRPSRLRGRQCRARDRPPLRWRRRSPTTRDPRTRRWLVPLTTALDTPGDDDGSRRHGCACRAAPLRHLPADRRLPGEQARRHRRGAAAPHLKGGEADLRRGLAFVLMRRDGAILLRKRPPKGAGYGRKCRRAHGAKACSTR